MEQFLGDEVRFGLPLWPDNTARMVGWGRKSSYHRAARYSAWRSLPCLSLEDGFLRSVNMGCEEPPLSIVIDDLGIYYDASVPSRLETLIGSSQLDQKEIQRTHAIIQAWRTGRLSKYNHVREWTEETAGNELPERFILVVDQTFGDASIQYGMANENSFQRMLEAALDEHPDSCILLKIHPEVVAGRKKGHFDRLSKGQSGRVKVLGLDVHPPSLLERAEAVYTVTSQMGFEGLLWGKPVRVFGMPFYAGWGLTNDDIAAPIRRKPISLEKLVHAALVDYPRYVDPEKGRRCEVERVMDYLSFQRQMRQRFPVEVHAIGFPSFRRKAVHNYFGGSRLLYHKNASNIPPNATIAVWGRDETCTNLPAGTQQICLEDGFLRSVGLGADMVKPLSLAMDRQGIYYDSSQPGDLEDILLNSEFDSRLLGRAKCLRERIVECGLTKYNVGSYRWKRPENTKRVILVTGQVEDDASIRYGSPHIKTNLELLMAVRHDNPDAYIVYKPHPDVEAGLRRGMKTESTVDSVCDEIVLKTQISTLLERVDEVHVMTSLTGFEALLRNKHVVTYGQPFYSGWGLTKDHYPPERQGRKLILDELVAGVLILYPAYVSRVTGRFTTPERVLDELLSWRESRPYSLPLGKRLRRLVMRAFKR